MSEITFGDLATAAHAINGDARIYASRGSYIARIGEPRGGRLRCDGHTAAAYNRGSAPARLEGNQ